MAAAIAASSPVENVLGLLLVSAGLMAIGSAVGSALTTGAGAALFGVGAAIAETSTAGLLLVGSGLFAAMVVHDLAGSFRRAPAINRGIWADALVNVLVVAATAGLLFGVAYNVATLTRWQAIVFPFGLAAVGFAAKLAADAHQRRVRNR
jgi:hypothetical protein